MSYQSKYTGLEIDELLDQINNGSANFEYKELSDGAIDVQHEGHYSLKESVKNYDMLIISCGFYIGDKATPECTNTFDDTCVVFTKDIVDLVTTYQVARSNGGVSNDSEWGAFVQIIFKNDREFWVPSVWKGSGITNWCKQASCVYGVRVFGVNFKGGDSAPTGNIISFMGTKAPKGYLICDGTELNVADYPRLATHFETQFGSKNYFGGDGTTTFAVPNLRNEFLRGYGDRTNEIGIHQDATNLPNIYTANNGKGLLVPLYNASSGTTSQANNVDSQKNETDYGTDSSKYQISQFNGSLITDSNYGSVMQSYTARPTNVAVLYCIKY